MELKLLLLLLLLLDLSVGGRVQVGQEDGRREDKTGKYFV